MSELPDEALAEIEPTPAEPTPAPAAVAREQEQDGALPPAVFPWHNDDTYRIPWVPAW